LYLSFFWASERQTNHTAAMQKKKDLLRKRENTIPRQSETVSTPSTKAAKKRQEGKKGNHGNFLNQGRVKEGPPDDRNKQKKRKAKRREKGNMNQNTQRIGDGEGKKKAKKRATTFRTTTVHENHGRKKGMGN